MNYDEDFATYAAARWAGLVRSAVFLGAGTQEAEDLAQTTLIRIYRAWPRIDRDNNHDAYLYKTLVNGFRSSRRRKWWGERPTERLPEPAAVPDESERIATAAVVHRALAGLSESARAVVVLRYFVQLSESETAEALGIPPGTVKSRLSRALSQLALDPNLEGISS